jgi:hypothetical protein
LPETNTQAYDENPKITTVKSFIVQALGLIGVKLELRYAWLDVTFNNFYSRNLQMLVISWSAFPGIHLQTILMFMKNVGTYPSKAPFKLSAFG